MGISDIFTEYANLTRISPKPKTRLREVKQKAFINVDEYGSTAAAVTVGTFKSSVYSTVL